MVKGAWFDKFKEKYAKKPPKGWKKVVGAPVGDKAEKAGMYVVVKGLSLTVKKTGEKKTVRIYAVKTSEGFLRSAKGDVYYTREREKAVKRANAVAQKRPKEKRAAHHKELVDFLRARKGKAPMSAQDIAHELERDQREVQQDLAALAKAGKIKRKVKSMTLTHQSSGVGHKFGGVVTTKHKQAHYSIESEEEPPMQNVLTEFHHLTGYGSSIVEKSSTTGMAPLEAIGKAFSAKVTLKDVPYLRYRKVGNGVELEDMAGRLGGILTSVEPREADPKALMAFLKKHGAKTLKAEALEEAVEPKIRAKNYVPHADTLDAARFKKSLALASKSAQFMRTVRTTALGSMGITCAHDAYKFKGGGYTPRILSQMGFDIYPTGEKSVYVAVPRVGNVPPGMPLKVEVVKGNRSQGINKHMRLRVQDLRVRKGYKPSLVFVVGNKIRSWEVRGLKTLSSNEFNLGETGGRQFRVRVLSRA
jgi:hypothetical protein